MGGIYRRAYEVWIWLGNVSDAESSPLPVLEEIVALVGTPRDTASRNLSELLLLTRSYKATNTRDKIYAFLNLLTERSTYIDINYDLTTYEIYMQVARHFGESSRKLDFLSWVQNGNTFSSYHLRSWTRD